MPKALVLRIHNPRTLAWFPSRTCSSRHRPRRVPESSSGPERRPSGLARGWKNSYLYDKTTRGRSHHPGSTQSPTREVRRGPVGVPSGEADRHGLGLFDTEWVPIEAPDWEMTSPSTLVEIRCQTRSWRRICTRVIVRLYRIMQTWSTLKR